MTRIVQIPALLAVLALVGWGVGCKNNGHHGSLVDTLPNKPTTVKAKQFPRRVRLNQKKLVKVHWRKPARSFHTTRRQHKLERYPCGSCHKKPITIRSKTQFQTTHGDIALKHASPGVLKCQSCHDSKKMNKLKLPTGQFVSFDRSYRLCSSCHSKQGRDWAGGAHGKRLHNWIGTRAVKNCTSCHNPHRPAFGQRWPKTYFRLPPKRR